MAESFDALILGGGIIGASLAEELSRHGRHVALIERDRIGAEASTAAAGILSSQADVAQPDAFFDLCQASRKMYPRWIEHVQRRSGLSVGYSVDGVLHVAMNSKEEKLLDKRIRWQLKRGLKVTRLSPREAKRFNAAIDGRIKRAYFFPTEAQIDNALLMAALGAACQKAGVETREGVTATRLRMEGGEIKGVDTDRGAFDAPIVVNCLGSWAGVEGLTPQPLPVVPIRGQMLVFDGPKGSFRTPVIGERAYAIQRRDGRVLVGSTLEPAGFHKALTLGGMHEILCGLRHITSAVNNWTYLTAWAGLRPCAPDKLPVMGQTSVKGLYVATGHYRHGILLAPVTAHILTELILNGRTGFDIEPFSPLRFTK